MPCYGPITGYYSKSVNPETGRRSIHFNHTKAWEARRVMLPCGKCVGCQMENARRWSLRCSHEKVMWSASAFVTLTYRNGDMPSDGFLKKRDVQLFMKRLRKKRPVTVAEDGTRIGLRFFACGEYGETTFRPHYHILLLNTRFNDIRLYGKSDLGEALYTSEECDELWKLGDCKIGEVTSRSIAYTCRYMMKKLTGDAVRKFGKDSPHKPFTLKSNRPGLGYFWFQKYGADAYRHDSAVMDGRYTSLTRYYDGKYELVDKAHLEELKYERLLSMEVHADELTPERMRAREAFEIAKAARFKREV